MLKVALLHIVAVLMLLPSTVAALIFSLLTLQFWVGSLQRGEYDLATFLIPLAIVIFWFGLVTGWRLYNGLADGRNDLFNWVTWTGLSSGIVVPAALLLFEQGSLWFRAALVWPLLAMVSFAVALVYTRYHVAT